MYGASMALWDRHERAVVREACYALDLPPHGFDL